MSNDIVGQLYKDVIENVISISRGDFEDNGIEEAVLQELRELWQQKLSSFGVARFPWDTTAPTAGVGGPALAGLSYDGTGILPPGIKQEEDRDAAVRAAQNVQQYGQDNKDTIPNVDRSVEALMRSRGGVLTPDMFNARGGTSSPNSSTTTGNENGASAGAGGTPRNIGTPGGLVLPGRGNSSNTSMNQTDGPGDDDEDEDDDGGNDSEQIGSDLDDSEDDLASGAEDEEEEGGMIMLCLYDKVQRVKNKWKYILKDGIANVNGKDYVFSRGTGESEW